MLTDPHLAMLNWSRWAHSGEQHGLDAKISSLWRFWLPHRHRDEGWGDPAAPEAIPDPVDTNAAEATDKALKRVAWQHYNILREWYYRHQRQDTEALAAALRALELVLGQKKTLPIVDSQKRVSYSAPQGPLALNFEQPPL